MNGTRLIRLILWTVSDHGDVELFVTGFSLTELMPFLVSIQVKCRRCSGGRQPTPRRVTRRGADSDLPPTALFHRSLFGILGIFPYMRLMFCTINKKMGDY